MTGDKQNWSQVEGGLLLLLDAVKAGDPKEEIIWRIEEELRLVRIAGQEALTTERK